MRQVFPQLRITDYERSKKFYIEELLGVRTMGSTSSNTATASRSCSCSMPATASRAARPTSSSPDARTFYGSRVAPIAQLAT